MNEFVKYLNSINSAKSESMNALAESQLLSEYYSKIEVKREISNVITRYLKKDEPESIILTGHAGDGKTSILIQVLKEFGYFNKGIKPLKIKEEFNNLFYIKDMSELSVNQQKELLWKFLKCRKNNMSAMIVSNTGPIINSFKAIFENKVSDEEIEKKILKGIENTISDEIEITTDSDEYRFRMVNIANIDNSYMIESILNKLLDKELWNDCFSCIHKEKCPIYNNYIDVSDNFESVSDQIGKIYFWLSERGTRLTIRQILAHITFSLTSNLNCHEISQFADNLNANRKYSFANGFFGAYDDSKLKSSALNIKTIKELNKIGLDSKSLGIYDDILFVKEKFNMFPKRVKNRLENILSTSIDDISRNNMNSSNLRKEFRRYFIIFASYFEDRELIDNLIISESFMDYYRAVTSKERLPHSENRKLKKNYFLLLYIDILWGISYER